ncbi:hypothetical protein ACF0H5_016499 [Mactra antiquata]
MDRLLLLVIVGSLFVLSINSQEPENCDNKFEYVYNIIDKLVTLKHENTAQDERIKQLESRLKETQENFVGSTYVRWGRKKCPTGVETVYDGFMAGSWYNYQGNGANFLCLPLDPIWGSYSPADGPSSIHGTDYKIGGAFEDHEAPCAVCWIPRATTLMLPAKNKCHDGWQLEYSGYIVANDQSKFRSEYVCLDEEPQTVGVEKQTSGNGAYLYYVEVRCGSLPCDVYPRGRELTCAVCSK